MSPVTLHQPYIMKCMTPLCGHATSPRSYSVDFLYRMENEETSSGKDLVETRESFETIQSDDSMGPISGGSMDSSDGGVLVSEGSIEVHLPECYESNKNELLPKSFHNENTSPDEVKQRTKCNTESKTESFIDSQNFTCRRDQDDILSVLEENIYSSTFERQGIAREKQNIPFKTHHLAIPAVYRSALRRRPCSPLNIETPSNRRVHFSASLVSEVRERPRTLNHDLGALFYSESDLDEFEDEVNEEEELNELISDDYFWVCSSKPHSSSTLDLDTTESKDDENISIHGCNAFMLQV